MVDNNSSPVHKPISRSDEHLEWRLIAFLLLALTAILLPYFLVPLAGDYWASLVAIGVCLIWTKTMPTSCINGGMIYSFVALAVLFNSIAIVLAATIRIVVTAFT